MSRHSPTDRDDGVWMMMSYVLGITGVINSFVSQNLGAGKAERGAAYTWNGLWVGLVYWICC